MNVISPPKYSNNYCNISLFKKATFVFGSCKQTLYDPKQKRLFGLPAFI